MALQASSSAPLRVSPSLTLSARVQSTGPVVPPSVFLQETQWEAGYLQIQGLPRACRPSSEIGGAAAPGFLPMGRLLGASLGFRMLTGAAGPGQVGGAPTL